jgi:hypothetical protein
MGGIPGGSLEPYKFEVYMQCHAATIAWNRAFGRLMSPLPSELAEKHLHALTAIGDLQAFLVTAGILSDLFFPDPKRGDPSRGLALQGLYQVDAQSPLANKKVRNSFIHVDERLDKWLPTRAGRKVGPFAIVWGTDLETEVDGSSALRIVDTRGTKPGDWKIVVRGEPLVLLPLLLEIDRIVRTFPLEVNGADGETVRLVFEPARFS